MATIITEECINCGACEPECPNTAIFQGGVEYEWGGGKHAAISDEFFFIVPEKCTECVGFFDYEACAAVCPVDCCVTDPGRPETEEVLLARAKELHPDKEFSGTVPSRFREGAGGPPAGDESAPATTGVAAAAPVAAMATGAAVTAAPAVGPSEFDVPIHCRSCNGDYAVQFRFLSPGTILRCPYCGVSFNPPLRMYRAIAGRLDAYADQMNAEIERHNAQIELEQELFVENVDDIRGSAEREIRRLVLEATEPPKRSMFG